MSDGLVQRVFNAAQSLGRTAVHVLDRLESKVPPAHSSRRLICVTHWLHSGR